MQKEPRHRLLHKLNSKPIRRDADRYSDSVDWDRVHEDYFKWIISPLAPEMTTPDVNGRVRNVLLTRLREHPDIRRARIIDYGCGPGNLLEHLKGYVDEIHGLDISEGCLNIASDRAEKLGIRFVKILADMRTYSDDANFDVIITINSLLPKDRKDVLVILKNMRDHLAVNGRLFAILPSFDTCVALLSYWEETYHRRSTDEEYVRRCVASFKAVKKMDGRTYSFADDGVHVQCFHTPETIEREFREAGLRIVGQPKKVEYPWEYTRDFDYGYFPDKPEIWDWFVEAERVGEP